MSNSTAIENRLHWEACNDVSRWYIFFGSSIACLLGGILFILAYRLLRRSLRWLRKRCTRRQSRSGDARNRKRSSALAVQLDDGEDVSSDSSAMKLSVTQKLANCCTTITEIIHAFAVYVVSYQTIIGRGFIALSMILSLCSFGIYVFEATVWPNEVEKCGHKGRRFRTFDFIINLFFLFHFIVRWIAARDVLLFWINGFSVVDYLTVPPIIIGYMIRRTWLGFRFARIFRLTNLAEVLHNLNVIKSVSSLHLCHFVTIFLSIWFSGAGMYLLLENSGNVFSANIYDVANPITYPNALYFTMVTMSTVGYGDITPQTLLGRIFICFFILIALATFAGAIPVIEESFFSVRKYHGSYTKPEGISHIVVCGDINTDSVKTFLASFLHEDRRRSDVEVVFINPSLPDLQLQSILRLHFSRVKYFQGTVMDQNDLQRVRMDEADACLILASSTASNPDQKDAANIMRVIAVKNYASHVRVIVQLLQTQNKAHLFNSPYWNWDAGDEILCFSELKLGFLAQSCVAPGFSTLLINLFSMRSEGDLKRAEKLHDVSRRKHSHAIQTGSRVTLFSRTSLRGSQRISNGITSHHPPTTFSAFIGSVYQKPAGTEPTKMSTGPDKHDPALAKRIEDKKWFHDYLYGMSMEIYSARFSQSFTGLPFSQAAIICRQNLDLLLIAILAEIPSSTEETHDAIRSDSPTIDSEDEQDYVSSEGRHFLAINPTDASGIVIHKNTIGFFVCDAQKSADRATIYCARCHGSQRLLTPVHVKPCDCGLKTSSSTARFQHWWSRRTNASSVADGSDEEHLEMKATSGDSAFEGVTLRSGDKKIHRLKHVSSEQLRASGLDMTGMYHYCPTRSFEKGHLLRATSATWRSEQLYNHIVVCLVTEEDSPLLGLHSFVMPLRASNIRVEKLKSIVFVGNETFLRREWPNLENFPAVHYLPGSPLYRCHLRAARIRCCSTCVVLGAAVHSRNDDRFLLDKEVVLCSLNIRAMQFQKFPSNTKIPKVFHRRFGHEIPLITELVTDANIHYLDPNETNPVVSHIPPVLSATFARGASFTSSVLDVLASTAYFDGHAITVIRHLISGGVTPAMEQWFAEGGRLDPYETQVKDDTESENQERTRSINRSLRRMHVQLGSLEVRQRPRLAMLSVLSPHLRSRPTTGFNTFGDLFCHAIERFGILCIGLYRNRYLDKTEFDMTIDDDEPTTQIPMSSQEQHEKENETEKLTIPTTKRDPALEYSELTTRFVITNPPNYFRLHRSDLVFCLCPYEVK